MLTVTSDRDAALPLLKSLSDLIAEYLRLALPGLGTLTGRRSASSAALAKASRGQWRTARRNLLDRADTNAARVRARASRILRQVTGF
jgi:hypothetical protein